MTANPITGRPSLLVNGRIPAGKPCPWATTCKHFMPGRCPSAEARRTVAFSCALARFCDAFDKDIERPTPEGSEER